MIEVIGVVFDGHGKDGDFEWMIRQPEHDDTLFIFNDNEEQFAMYLAGIPCDYAGIGNSAVRPYRAEGRAAGIPTGSLANGGYTELSPALDLLLDEAFRRIEQLLASGRFKRVVYSSDGQGSLGTGTFKVGPAVLGWIMGCLAGLARD